jgi:hypothetical protein
MSKVIFFPFACVAGTGRTPSGPGGFQFARSFCAGCKAIYANVIRFGDKKMRLENSASARFTLQDLTAVIGPLTESGILRN